MGVNPGGKTKLLMVYWQLRVGNIRRRTETVVPFGIALWLSVDSPLACFQSAELQQIYLPEAQQKLDFPRIWNLWETLPPGSLEWLLLDLEKHFNHLKQA